MGGKGIRGRTPRSQDPADGGGTGCRKAEHAAHGRECTLDRTDSRNPLGDESTDQGFDLRCSRGTRVAALYSGERPAVEQGKLALEGKPLEKKLGRTRSDVEPDLPQGIRDRHSLLSEIDEHAPAVIALAAPRCHPGEKIRVEGEIEFELGCCAFGTIAVHSRGRGGLNGIIHKIAPQWRLRDAWSTRLEPIGSKDTRGECP